MFSKIVRRTHMYLALFLTPWILMYAASTVAMNHRGFFLARHGDAPAPYEVERQVAYPTVFDPDAAPRLMAAQLLSDLGLDGVHRVRMTADRAALVIERETAVTPRRITYRPGDGTVVVEREAFRAHGFLERLHQRRGYESDYRTDDAWALSVDLVIVAMLFWVASGLWLWWELKATRKLGAALAATGLAAFVLFVFTI